MEYVEFGDTGECVSRLGFGGAPAGLANYLGTYDPDEETGRAAVIEAIETALDCGVTYFDTAPGYGEGASALLFEASAGVDGATVDVAGRIERPSGASPQPTVSSARRASRATLTSQRAVSGGAGTRAVTSTVTGRSR